jgi:hypothetical protein
MAKEALMKTQEAISKALGAVLALLALSALSGCVVAARPARVRTVYVAPARTVYVAPARTVYVRPW